MEEKLKHLEFIQNCITRMGSNSFLLKGWCITLVSALFALAAQGANKDYVLVTYFVIPVFWFLDGFFISRERRFRELYDDVRQNGTIDFSMNIGAYNTFKTSWLCGVFSKTLWPFYGVSIVATVIVMFLIK
jgi:hypothetical protein